MSKSKVVQLLKIRQPKSGPSEAEYGTSPMARLSMEPIIAKLCHPSRGLGWDLDRAVFATEQYRRWLWLNAKYEAEHMAPSKDVDQVWHMHILDTRKYAEDCLVMFNGRILHHNPYAGWESKKAETEHQSNYRRTQELFVQHFGRKLVGAKGLCDSGYCDKDTDSRRDFWRPTLANIGTGVAA